MKCSQDKGVHDGRNNDHDDTEAVQSSSPQTARQAEQPHEALAQSSSQEEAVQLTVSKTVNLEIATELKPLEESDLNLTITIPSAYTIDRVAHKEIEFLFNPRKDKYEVSGLLLF
jgi:hypothetical protein